MTDACCSVGARPDVAALDEALRSGKEGVRAVAKRFDGVSKTQLGRHRLVCLGLSAETLGVEVPGATRPPRLQAGEHPAAPPRDAAGTSRDASHGTNAPLAAAGAHASALAAAADCEPTFEARVNCLADIIASGEYEGRPTANHLCRIWRIGRGAVQNYMRAAAVLVRGDTGEREERRQTSMARWQRLYQEARDIGDLNAATKAQAGWDRAAGVVEPVGAKVNIQLGESDFGRGVAQFLLAACPELGPEFAAWCSAVQAGNQVARSDPAKWLMSRKDVVETTGEAAE